jgi:hypothetical protein
VLADAALGTARADTARPSLEEMPSANPESVTRLLQKLRRKWGEDAVVIDTSLLMHAMRNGSVLTTGARVSGVDEYAGKRYLGFHVETGLVFDDNSRNETARVHMLWHTIMVPTLQRLKGLTVPADGIMVRMQYFHSPYGSQRELRQRIHEPGPSEEACFYLLTPDVLGFVEKRVSPYELIARARVTVDGAERHVPVPVADEPLSPGPD